jgi:hypothetical protein
VLDRAAGACAATSFLAEGPPGVYRAEVSAFVVWAFLDSERVG